MGMISDSGAGISSMVTELWGGKPEERRNVWELTPELSNYMYKLAADLPQRQQEYRRNQGLAMAEYNAMKPYIQQGLTDTMAYKKQMAPGGAFQNLLTQGYRGAYDVAERALQQQVASDAAKNRLRAASLGQGYFGDTKYGRQSYAQALAPQIANLRAQQAMVEPNVAKEIAYRYNPAMGVDLAYRQQQYGLQPLAISAATDKAILDTATRTSDAYRNAFDRSYYWYRPKEWGDYAAVANQQVADVFDMIYGGKMGGGGMGGGGFGGFGG